MNNFEEFSRSPDVTSRVPGLGGPSDVQGSWDWGEDPRSDVGAGGWLYSEVQNGLWSHGDPL